MAVATLALAGVTVISAIGAVLLLAFRVGRLTGDVEARITYGEKERTKIWSALDLLTGRFDKHVERHNAGGQ